jgi:hypothetical protein
VTLAVFRHLDAAVAIKHTKESYAFAIEVLVANVGVLHGEPPALHGAERVPVPGGGRARLLMFEFLWTLEVDQTCSHNDHY